jgi:hypothetical protein
MLSELSKSQNQDFIEYLLLLRFGPSPNFQSLKPVLNYTSIALLSNISSRHASSLIALGVKHKQQKTAIVPKPKSKLSQQMKDFLLDPNILNDWAYLSLK